MTNTTDLLEAPGALRVGSKTLRLETAALISLTSLSLVLGGCVKYSGNRTPIVRATDGAAELSVAPRIKVVFSHRYGTSEESLTADQAALMIEKARKSFHQARKYTPFLKNAEEDLRNPDFVLDLRFQTSDHGMVSFLVSTLSLWIIPGFSGTEIAIDATLKTPTGETVGRHRASRETKMITHLLLFVALPFSAFTDPRDKMVDETLGDVLILTSRDLERFLGGDSVPSTALDEAEHMVTPE